jgi:hypothetical protein
VTVPPAQDGTAEQPVGRPPQLVTERSMRKEVNEEANADTVTPARIRWLSEVRLHLARL